VCVCSTLRGRFLVWYFSTVGNHQSNFSGVVRAPVSDTELANIHELYKKLCALRPILADLLRETRLCNKHVVLTSRCRKHQMRVPCDMSRLGTESLTYSPSSFNWNISSDNRNSRNALWQLIENISGLRSKLERLVLFSDSLVSLLKHDGFSLSAAQEIWKGVRMGFRRLWMRGVGDGISSGCCKASSTFALCYFPATSVSCKATQASGQPRSP